MRLVIGGPTRDTVPAAFALALADLSATTHQWNAAGRIWLRFVQATYVHVGRDAVLRAAWGCQATHVLWLDTDMTFPPDTAIRLAAHHRPVVAGNCVMKTTPPLCTAQRHGQRIETRPDSMGLEVVDSVGLAVMLMHMDVVADLPRPWFRHGLTDAGDDIGEDIAFCQALRDAGHEILIDHDLSKEIGHVGQYTYRSARETPIPVHRGSLDGAAGLHA